MKKRDTGGSIFRYEALVNEFGDVERYGNEGLTIRDYSAIEAMQGMLAHPRPYKPRKGTSKNWHEAIAEEAYRLADAMIAERKK